MEQRKENELQWSKGAKYTTASLCANTRLNRRIKKLAKQFPKEIKILQEDADGGITARIPTKLITIKRPVTGKTEEKQKAATPQHVNENKKRKNVLKEFKDKYPS